MRRLIEVRPNELVSKEEMLSDSDGSGRTYNVYVNQYGNPEFRNHPLEEGEMGIVVDYHYNYTHTFHYNRLPLGHPQRYEIQIQKTYAVSNGKSGLGNRRGSGGTSPGIHYVYFKQHMNAQSGEIVWAKPYDLVGKIVEPTQGDQWWEPSIITTRRIRLAGLERINSNTIRRAILFHGTHEEGFIGMQKSGGCIRMINDEVIELADAVEVGTLVNIVGDTENVDFSWETVSANNAPVVDNSRSCGQMNFFSTEIVRDILNSGDYSRFTKNQCNAEIGRF